MARRRPFPSPRPPSNPNTEGTCTRGYAKYNQVVDPHNKYKVNSMSASVQTKASRVASLKVITSPPRPRLVPASAGPTRELRDFPEAPTRPSLPASIRDEMIELYAFIFSQGGFRQLEMTFEQFLLVAAAVKPDVLPATREEARTLPRDS